MNAVITTRRSERQRLLLALKEAVIEGANWRYDELVEAALAAGATTEQIDLVAYEALQALLAGAEQPLTVR
jgi:hypothetical protein